MSIHTQFYMTCDGCGAVLCDKYDDNVYAESEEELREESEDYGWKEGVIPDRDYCPFCQEDHEKGRE